MLAGEFVSSRKHLEEVLALYDPASRSSLVDQAGVDPCINAQALLGSVLFCLGYLDQALARSNAAIAEARRLGHQPSLAVALALGARLCLLVGDNTALTERVSELTAVSTEQSFAYWRALATIYGGWVKVEYGNVAEGIALIRSGSTAYCATGAAAWRPFHLSLLTRACEIAGDVGEAVTLLDDALQIAAKTGERLFTAELNTRKGQLLQRQGKPETAEERYRKALSIAVEQEAKLWELRAAMSLARLLCDQGHRAEARDLLAPVYGWFTEGFDTPDLKDAKTLLSELNT
jgi:predicted ATPase